MSCPKTDYCGWLPNSEWTNRRAVLDIKWTEWQYRMYSKQAQQQIPRSHCWHWSVTWAALARVCTCNHPGLSWGAGHPGRRFLNTHCRDETLALPSDNNPNTVMIKTTSSTVSFPLQTARSLKVKATHSRAKCLAYDRCSVGLCGPGGWTKGCFRCGALTGVGGPQGTRLGYAVWVGWV